MPNYDDSTIIIRDKLYIPSMHIDMALAEKLYTHDIFKESDCRRCPNKPQRPNFECDQCPAFSGTVSTYSTEYKNDIEYVGLPLGERHSIEKKFHIDFRDFDYIDLRVRPKFDYKVKTNLVMRDYQEEAISTWWDHKYGLIIAPPRSGKCVTGDTDIQTEFGQIRIESLFDGIPLPEQNEDQYLPREFDILTANGVRKTSHIYRKWDNLTYHVNTEYGYSIRGVEDHPVLVFTKDLHFVWTKLKDVKEGDYLCINRKQSLFSVTDFTLTKFKPPKHHNIKKYPFNHTINEDLAFILGYLVADGNLGRNSISLSSGNKLVTDDFINRCRKVFNYVPLLKTCNSDKVASYRINSVFICSVLEHFGLKLCKAAEKEIPFSVLQSGESIVRAFLTAYFSCDSGVKGNAISLLSASHKLIKQLQVLLSSFGFIGRRSRKFKKATNSKTPTTRPYYSLCLRGMEADNFHNEFNLLKFQNKDVSRNRSSKDYVPYARDHLRAVINKSEDYSIYHKCRLNRNHHYLGYSQVNSLDLNRLSKIDPTLSASISIIRDKNFYFSKVIKNNKICKPTLVYDVTVPEGHHYLGNSIASHNTPMMLFLSVKLGLRTLLVASQHEFLQQFIDHIEQYTNLPQLQEKYGKKLYGFPRKPEDFNTLQIGACTYQQFTASNSGKERYKLANKNFGTLLIDEAHKGAANNFASVINSSRARIRMGVTGTDKRKDGRHKILYNIVGPAVKRVNIDQLQANVIVHVCDYVTSKSAYRGPAGYVYACKMLANHKKRNEEILKWVGSDLAKGHSIIIPVTFRDYVTDLVKAINDMYGSEIAEGFVGGGTKKNKEQREAILDRCKMRKTRVVVGIRSILQLGLNVPPWSAIYNIVPMSNEPNWKQESSRILTPDPNKRKPIIRMFVDPNIGLSLGCFVATYKQSLKFKHTPTKKGRERALAMFELHGGGRRDMEDAESAYDIDYEEDDNYQEGGRYHKKKTKPKRESARGKGLGLFGGGRK